MDQKLKKEKRTILLKKLQEQTVKKIISLGSIEFSTEDHFSTQYQIEKTVGRLFLRYSKFKMPPGMYSLMDFSSENIVYRNKHIINRIVIYDEELVNSFLDHKNTVSKYYAFYDYIASIQTALQNNANKLRWLCGLIYENKINYLDWKQKIRRDEKFSYPSKFYF